MKLVISKKVFVSLAAPLDEWVRRALVQKWLIRAGQLKPQRANQDVSVDAVGNASPRRGWRRSTTKLQPLNEGLIYEAV